MTRENLERYLERGESLGFQKETSTDDYLGWILLSKRQPDERYLTPLTHGEEPELVKQQKLIRQKPYQILIQELRRDVHESDKYETNEDYRINESFYFADLDEVEAFVQNYGHTLKDIKWRVDLDAP